MVKIQSRMCEKIPDEVEGMLKEIYPKKLDAWLCWRDLENMNRVFREGDKMYSDEEIAFWKECGLCDYDV